MDHTCKGLFIKSIVHAEEGEGSVTMYTLSIHQYAYDEGGGGGGGGVHNGQK